MTENGSLDPDATPVDGTRAVRTWSTRRVPAARTQRRSVQRIDSAQRQNPSRRIGVPRTLAFALVGTLVMLVALLVADLTAPSIFDSLRNIAATPNPKQAHHPAPTRSVRHAPKPSADAPVLTGLSPESATAGSTIELNGRGFFSANNQITARVAGEPAPTRCPTRQRCFVVLPAASKGVTETSIQIVTEAGSSNSLPIRYG